MALRPPLTDKLVSADKPLKNIRAVPDLPDLEIEFLFFCLMKLKLTFCYPDFNKSESSNEQTEINTQSKENLTCDFYRLKNQSSKILKGYQSKSILTNSPKTSQPVKITLFLFPNFPFLSPSQTSPRPPLN